MKFNGVKFIWLTRFPGYDFSIGVHICLAGRIDLHLFLWMVSLGNVPTYNIKGKTIAVSNSFHKTKKGPARAGVP